MYHQFGDTCLWVHNHCEKMKATKESITETWTRTEHGKRYQILDDVLIRNWVSTLCAIIFRLKARISSGLYTRKSRALAREQQHGKSACSSLPCSLSITIERTCPSVNVTIMQRPTRPVLSLASFVSLFLPLSCVLPFTLSLPPTDCLLLSLHRFVHSPLL